MMTFDACRDAYIAAHEASWTNRQHRTQWINSLTRYVSPIIGKLPVKAIDTGLVLKVLEPHWNTKTETMSRVRGRIEAILDWARVRGYREGENPARWKGHMDHMLPGCSKINKKKHHSALPYEQVGAFVAELRQRPHPGAGAGVLRLVCQPDRRSDRRPMGRV
jgi:hypothetical protein